MGRRACACSSHDSAVGRNGGDHDSRVIAAVAAPVRTAIIFPGCYKTVGVAVIIVIIAVAAPGRGDPRRDAEDRATRGRRPRRARQRDSAAPLGRLSTLLFKAYEQGRTAWQGDTLHGVWFDEEPPLDIYSEGLTCTNATGGIVMLTFTPLKGLSEVVRMYLSEGELSGLK
jgi:phage terminase large subunit-like protein